jgi:hypothetical protein
MQNVQEQKQDPSILSLSLSLSSFIVPEFLPKLFHVSEACHSTKALEKLVPHLFFHKRHILHQTNFNLGFADFLKTTILKVLLP